MTHGLRHPIQPKLVHTLLRLPASLGHPVDHKKETPRKEGNQRTIDPRLSRFMRATDNGDLRHVNELVELCAPKLADNTLANLLRSHTLRLPAAEVSRTILLPTLTHHCSSFSFFPFSPREYVPSQRAHILRDDHVISIQSKKFACPKQLFNQTDTKNHETLLSQAKH